jgi:unsaturated rhamnogalacturonyl hydrolase
VNTTAPLSTVLHLGTIYSDPIYQETCRKYDQYLLHEIQRASNGAINHTTVKKENPGLVWADTLFMSIIYLARRGAFLKDNTYLDEAFKQLQAHVDVLYDKTSGLFYHGWSDHEKKWLGVRWGRGNAWITASIIDILQNISEDSQAKQDILVILDQHLSSLKNHQDSDGFWRTVIDEAWTYRETTVTAGMVYGILKGIRLGFVDPTYKEMAEKALQAVLTKIDQHGVMDWASGGTPIKEDTRAYNEIAFNVSPYSQGLALMALSEAVMTTH